MKFLKALDELDFNISGNEWEKIAKEVGKSESEVKVHAQQYFLKLERERRIPTENVLSPEQNMSSQPMQPYMSSSFIVPFGGDLTSNDPNQSKPQGVVWTPEEARIFEDKISEMDPNDDDRLVSILFCEL
eukprot:768405-Hanusia_phi.AAC.6